MIRQSSERLSTMTSSDDALNKKAGQNKLQSDEFQPARFRALPFITVILIIILFISQAIQWYSQSVTLPRFCEDPELAIHNLQEIITLRSPAGKQSRRPYIIAAKLIYLIPQQADESVQNYIHRVRRELNRRCMQ